MIVHSTSVPRSAAPAIGGGTLEILGPSSVGSESRADIARASRRLRGRSAGVSRLTRPVGGVLTGGGSEYGGVSPGGCDDERITIRPRLEISSGAGSASTAIASELGESL